MVNILNPQFLKWNCNNSEEHFDIDKNPDAWETGAETFFSVFNYELFTLCTYSKIKKDYQLETAGIRMVSQEQRYTEIPLFSLTNEVAEHEMGEQHEIEIEWVITEPKGHVHLTIDGNTLSIEWDGKIKDLQGNEARLLGVGNGPYRVEEILNSKERETLIEIKRLARLRDMSTGKVREMLNFRMIEASK